MTTTTSPATIGRLISRESAADAAAPRVGPWRLLKLAADGEFTRVYRAQPADGGPGALYAIKVLSGEGSENLEAIQRFVREAAAGRSLTHRHLVPILSAQVER